MKWAFSPLLLVNSHSINIMNGSCQTEKSYKFILIFYFFLKYCQHRYISRNGKATAKSIVKNVVDSQIDDLLTNRKDAIKTYENALMFLAEATKPQQQ